MGGRGTAAYLSDGDSGGNSPEMASVDCHSFPGSCWPCRLLIACPRPLWGRRTPAYGSHGSQGQIMGRFSSYPRALADSISAHGLITDISSPLHALLSQAGTHLKLGQGTPCPMY
ncbi:hypothetical protein LZ31DRAFT_188883 [Colletotrichum somersetense]|nr:hypothetical protein LZ31DRAFT_188883 [Colletotrichum somersetense]